MTPPFDPQRYLGLTDEELQQMPPYDRRHPSRTLFWLVYVKRKRLVRGAVIIVLSIAAVTTGLAAIFAVLEPWNHSLWLWPTLTGEWTGELTTAEGRRHLVLFAIEGDNENPPIDGAVTTCDERGVVRTFSLSGWPHGWRGTTFRLETGGSGDADGVAVRLARIDGEWAGDTMRATATLEYVTRVGGSAISSSTDPQPAPVAPVTLHRGGRRDFNAACAGRRGASGKGS